ncbi:UPF0041-domain-containing protein [Pseudovirgaria hyperparasitica]|uniref:Mitochondrial pyruvate carrier n=1 Tax=Pseudovirgaria hyperparasitica TaxID=470096 RepID=A0A6A6WAX3_9PEZI|nr:UPF0041-domain-containing protein [Pseudovirgaria hyperparasitica]KAF2759329.1 UPF0041-domain-containing protein [Pseudovirgaria hyperparasitica]
MAAAIKALNAKIRSNPVSNYLCSTHFWGPASNFGIPIAAVMDTQKDPEYISGPMTVALMGYSAVFMRYALAVTPRNYLLFGCHVVNFSAQTTQGYRYANWWNFGGREKAMEERAKSGIDAAVNTAKETASDASAKIKGAANDASAKAHEAVDKIVGKK